MKETIFLSSFFVWQETPKTIKCLPFLSKPQE
jgi:hypothetical protein